MGKTKKERKAGRQASKQERKKNKENEFWFFMRHLFHTLFLSLHSLLVEMEKIWEVNTE